MRAKTITLLEENTGVNLHDLGFGHRQDIKSTSNNEEEMAVHSRILTWEISWTEKPGRLCPWGHKRIGHDLATQEDHAKNIFKSNRYFLTSSVALKIAFKKGKINMPKHCE